MVLLFSLVLLDTIPIASILGILTSALIVLLSFLLKDAYNKIIERIGDLEKENRDLKESIGKTNTKVDLELRNTDGKIDKEMRAIDYRMSELKFNILEKLDDIKKQFNELRK